MDNMRVVINLNDNAKCYGKKPLNTVEHLDGAEVELIDNKILMSQEFDANTSTHIGYKMRFDYVNQDPDYGFDQEIDKLISELFSQRQDCSLVRFEAKQECSLCLHNLLLSAVDKRMEQLHFNVHYICVRYKDVEAENLYLGNTSGVIQFQTTRQLQHWLLNDYRIICAEIVGHELLELEFKISSVDNPSDHFLVKLLVFKVYMQKMDKKNEKYYEYIDYVGNGGADTHFQHTSLTSCLHTVLTSARNGNTLLFYEIPVELNKTTNEGAELLQMAHAVVKTRLKSTSNNVHRIDKTNTHHLADFAIMLNPTVESNKYSKTSKKTSIPSLVNYTSIDFKSLSAWYHKIDVQFSLVCGAMELYNQRCYELKTKRMCRDIKFFTHFYQPLEIALKSNAEQLQSVHQYYRMNITSFDKLTVEIESSKYADTLRVYLATKHFDLKQFCLNIRLEQLKSCRNLLSNLFNKECQIVDEKLKNFSN